MDFESLLPFFVLLGLFLSVFIVEAAVLTAFKILPFFKSLGVLVIVNMASFVLIYYVAGAILTKIGYQVGQFNGLTLPIQGIAFLWWFATVTEGLLISFWLKTADRKKVFLSSMIMNAVSFSILLLFVENSH